MKRHLTRPFLPDKRQLWLSFPIFFIGASNVMGRPIMPQDEFFFVICLLFAFIFALNAVLDLHRIPARAHGFVVLWFAFLLLLLPVTLWETFNNAIWYRSHPMPDGGIGAR
jgi:hypothetical protein